MLHDDVNSPIRLLLLPGWLDSDAAHWQTRWQSTRSARKVVQNDWLWPKRGDWMARLDEVLLESDRPAVLVAHSLGCQLVAAWAAHSQHAARVRAAMLVAAPDTEREDTPPNLSGWRPIVRERLPFASLLVISSDDPYCAPGRAQQMARDWGSDAYDAGPCGHINAESKLGDWPEGWLLLQTLLDRSSTIL
jgi:uncharacterized protein